jgi:hypothetical protein
MGFGLFCVDSNSERVIYFFGIPMPSFDTHSDSFELFDVLSASLRMRRLSRITGNEYSLVEVILGRRRRRAEATGEPYEDPLQKSLFDVHNRPRSLDEVLRMRYRATATTPATDNA